MLSNKFAWFCALLVSIQVAAASEAPTTRVFVVSDSTAAHYGPERYPQLGWGSLLHCAFDDRVTVRNRARGGRSTKSFIAEGFWAQVESELQPGDTVLIQFGHNDANARRPERFTNPDGDYRTYLLQYIEATRARGAQPVLITPVARRRFEDGVLVDAHAPYAKAMREVAAHSGTQLVDLSADSMQWLRRLGPEASKRYFLNYTPADGIARYPDGIEDNTHFSEMGARKVANLVAARLAKLELPIAARIRSSRPGLTRSTPLGGPSCEQPFTERPPLVPAFPGAEGAGRLAAGGRGGAVLKVTQLGDSGPGSLRAAIETPGPRMVLFDISGTIELRSPLRVVHPRITIAGHSAPGDGITLRNHPLIVAADDVVIRYLRSRLGDTSGAESDAIWIARGRRIILDHVSASWSVDETLSVNNPCRDPAQGIYDATVQWSIIAESLNRSLHVKGPHGYGSLITGCNGARLSFHHNLWAHHAGRNPRPGNPAPPERDSIGALHDYRSNVFYNWGGRYAGYNADTGAKASFVQYNFVDNAYVQGPDSTGAIAFRESNERARAWFSGNTINGVLPQDPWTLVTGNTGPQYRLDRPVEVAPVAADPAPLAYERVLNEAGASLVRDAVDRRIVQSVRDRGGGLIDSQEQVGGWPALAAQPARADTDGDGMPDEWEMANGFDPARPDGRNGRSGSGYTNLEQYLNSLVMPRVAVVAADGSRHSTLQAAIDALPEHGGEILLGPGEYREKVTIDKPAVRLRGLGVEPRDVVIVWSDGAVTAGGTFRSATVNVMGDDFTAENLTIQNDYSLRHAEPSQAVALAVTGDRAIFRGVHLLGAQDTLYAGTKKCSGEECRTSRQYFEDCYIEGHVDFIFGDAKAFFDRCRIHALAHGEILLTAHARTAPSQDRAFVFDHCTVTADPQARNIYFGRPWRDYAAVIFMNTHIEADLHPAGWREWTPGKTERLRTAYYAEYRSSGRGADTSARQPHAHLLSEKEAARWSAGHFLAGHDNWRPGR